MRAAVLTEVNTPLQILDLEQEPPKANEVRVEVKAAGANVFVSGSGIFGKPDYTKIMSEMRDVIARTPAKI